MHIFISEPKVGFVFLKRFKFDFWNPFSNHFKKSFIYRFDLKIWVFKLIFESSIFEKSSKRLLLLLLVWPQFKMQFEIFETIDFKLKILEINSEIKSEAHLFKSFILARKHLASPAAKPAHSVELAHLAHRSGHPQPHAQAAATRPAGVAAPCATASRALLRTRRAEPKSCPATVTPPHWNDVAPPPLPLSSFKTDRD
jgi:hypothetical protein